MTALNQAGGSGALVLSDGIRPLEWLYMRGLERARETRALEAREEDLRSLSALAKSTAAHVARANFDPEAVPEDRIRDGLHRRADTSSKQLDEELRIAGKKCSESSDNAGRRRAQVGLKPELPLVAMVTSVGVLAVSVGPTLHDFVFHTLPDDLLNWFVSLVVSALLGVMLAWGLFSSSIARSRAPLVVGSVISLGLAALRLSAAETVQEVVFAIGLALIEVGVVVFLDWRAGLYNKDFTDWTIRAVSAQEAEASSNSQRSEYERLASERKRLEVQIRDHVSYVAHRDELAGDGAARERIYIESVCCSYLQGIAENRGRLQSFE